MELPFLEHPEIEKAEKKNREIKELREAEKLFFEYKIKDEERLSIFDEISESLTYESIIDSPYLKHFSKELIEEIKKHLESSKQADPKNKLPHQILYEDFIKLWAEAENDEEKKKYLHAMIFSSLRNIENQKIEELTQGIEKESRINKKELKKELRKLKETAEQRAVGKYFKINHLLEYKFKNILLDIAEYSKEDLEKIKEYALANRPKAEEILSKLKEMEIGVKVAKESGTAEGLLDESSIAALYKIEEEEVRKANQLLKEALELELGERKAKKYLGKETEFEVIEQLADKEFLTSYIYYFQKMKLLRRLFNEGKVVETDYVREIIEKAMDYLTNDPPVIVYFHGEYGTGKTAIATHISKTRFHKQPVIVAGNKFLDPDKLAEEFRLQKLPPHQILNELAQALGKKPEALERASLVEVLSKLLGTELELKEQLIKNYLKDRYISSLEEGKEFSEKDFEEYFEENKSKVPDYILNDVDKIIDIVLSNSVQGVYVLGAMYKCMKEGRPLIIDEANAIPPEVIIAFNDLLTKKVGETIQIRNKEEAETIEEGMPAIKVKKGYCIMWTGNTGERYVSGRYNDIDPATYSRIYPIEVGFLPQSTDINHMADLMERLGLDTLKDKAFKDREELLEFIKKSREQASLDQIFQVLFLTLLNKRNSAEVISKADNKYSTIEDIYKLSVGARIIMDLFTNNTENIPDMPYLKQLLEVQSDVDLAEKLQKMNLSMRELIDGTIRRFANSGMLMDIEYYLFDFITKFNLDPKEQLIAYAVLQHVGFFQEKGWFNYQDLNSLKEFKTKINKFNPAKEVEKYKNLETIEGESQTLLKLRKAKKGKKKPVYTYSYISSPEAVQMMFGYIAPRTPEEYLEIGKTLKEADSEKKIRELLDSIREITNSLTHDLFETQQEVVTLKNDLDKLKLKEKKWLIKASLVDVLGEVEKFNNILIGFLEKKEELSEKDLAELGNMTTEEKTEFLKKFFAKRNQQ
jgi:hypothetical protein